MRQIEVYEAPQRTARAPATSSKDCERFRRQDTRKRTCSCAIGHTLRHFKVNAMDYVRTKTWCQIQPEALLRVESTIQRGEEGDAAASGGRGGAAGEVQVIRGVCVCGLCLRCTRVCLCRVFSSGSRPGGALRGGHGAKVRFRADGPEVGEPGHTPCNRECYVLLGVVSRAQKRSVFLSPHYCPCTHLRGAPGSRGFMLCGHPPQAQNHACFVW